MSTQKEPAPNAAGAVREELTMKTTDCDVDSTTAGRKMQYIEQMLRRGSENATTTAELLNITGLKYPRALQRQIEKERDAGAVILSKTDDGGGYFRPAAGAQGRREIRNYVRTLENRAKRTFKATKSAKRVIADNDAQTTLEGW